MKILIIRDVVAGLVLAGLTIWALWPAKATADGEKESPLGAVVSGLALGLTLTLALVCIYGVSAVRTEGISMDTTIHDGSVLLMARTEYNPFVTPERGDIVSAYWEEEDKLLLKRVVAQPGDMLQIKDNVVYINGTAMPEDYIKEPMVTEDLSVQLGDDEYFLMGDNRNISLDSRLIGTFSGEDICGVLLANFG